MGLGLAEAVSAFGPTTDGCCGFIVASDLDRYRVASFGQNLVHWENIVEYACRSDLWFCDRGECRRSFSMCVLVDSNVWSASNCDYSGFGLCGSQYWNFLFDGS